MAARLLRSWILIPPGAWMFVVRVVCCQVEVSATDWSLVQRNPTDCGASLCVIKKSRTREGYSPARGLQNTNPQRVVAPVEKKSFSVNRTFARYTVEKYGKTRHATHGNIMRSIRIARWIIKGTYTHSEYVILIAFPRQSWLHERAFTLRCSPHSASLLAKYPRTSAWHTHQRKDNRLQTLNSYTVVSARW